MHPTRRPAAVSGRAARDPAVRNRMARHYIGIVKFYDPDAEYHDLPTYPYRWAPKGLATMRQLRALGLRPGGQDIAAQIMWRNRKRIRVAYLYRIDLALPKRDATPAQLAAIERALLARRTCPTCGQVKDYYIPISRGECNDCSAGWDR